MIAGCSSLQRLGVDAPVHLRTGLRGWQEEGGRGSEGGGRRWRGRGSRLLIIALLPSNFGTSSPCEAAPTTRERGRGAERQRWRERERGREGERERGRGRERGREGDSPNSSLQEGLPDALGDLGPRRSPSLCALLMV